MEIDILTQIGIGGLYFRLFHQAISIVYNGCQDDFLLDDCDFKRVGIYTVGRMFVVRFGYTEK